MRPRTSRRFAAALLASHAASAMADDGRSRAPGGEPSIEMTDVVAEPALDRLHVAGATTIYLGLDGRRRAYMATSSDGMRHQILYLDQATGATTYGESFDANGQSNAARQLRRAVERYEAMADGRAPAEPLDVDAGQRRETPTAEPSRQAASPTQPAEPSTVATTAPAPVAGPRELGMDKPTFLANVANSLATFPVGKPGTPKIYLVTSPSCEPCHEAWSELRGLVTQGKATVVVILAAPTKAEERLAAGVLAQQGTALAWYSGIGSGGDETLIPPPPATGSATRRQTDTYVRMNTMFARDLGAERLPVLAYEDGEGTWHVEERPDPKRVRTSIGRRDIARSRTGD